MKRLLTKIKNWLGYTSKEQDEMWDALCKDQQAQPISYSPYFDPQLAAAYQAMFNAAQQQSLQNYAAQQQQAYQNSLGHNQLGNYFQQSMFNQTSEK